MDIQTVLVADDEEFMRKMLKRTLSSPSCRILSASNGQEAIRLAEETNPDLILLDLHMPGKSGWEVLKELKENGRTRVIPVIVLSGDGEVVNKVAGLDSGADDYVTKPFSIDNVRARVGNMLRKNKIYFNPGNKSDPMESF